MDDRVGAVQPMEGGQEASTVVMLSVIGKLMRCRGGPDDVRTGRPSRMDNF